MVWLRRLGWIVLGVAVLAGAVLAYLVMTFDPQRYKSTLVDWVAQKHERTLVLNGPITLGVWPRLHVRLSQVALSEHRSKDQFAAADELDLSVQTLPLLRGALRVDRVGASGLSLRYVRDANGRSNIDDLLQPESADPKEPSSSEPLRFEVAAIELSGVTARVDDQLSGLRATVTMPSFRSGRLADGVKTDVALELSALMEQPRPAQLSLKGTMAVTPDLAKGSVLVDQLALDVGGEGGGIEQAKGRVTLARLLYDPAGQGLALSQLDLRLEGLHQQRGLSFALAWPELSIRGQQVKGSAFQGAFSLTGALPVDGRFEAQAPEGSFSAISFPGLVVDFKMAAQPAAGVPALSAQLKGLVSVYAPQASVSRVASVEWKLAGQLNTNPFNTQGTARLSSPHPHVQAMARFAALDLNRFLPAPGGSASAPRPAASAPSGASPDPVIDLSPLAAFNGRLDLEAAQLAWRHYRVADARILASLDGGRLTMQNLSGSAWGGRFQAKGSAQAGAPQRMALQAQAQGVNILALLKDVAGKEVLEGTGEVKLDVQTGGARLSQLTSGLSGQAAIVLRDGSVRGINLAKSLRDAKARLSGRGDEVQRSRQTEETDFTEMSASFRIDQGVARNDDLMAKSPFLRVGGKGQVDLPRRRLDYLVKATVTGEIQGQGGADLASLQGVTIPVLLSGPWDAPEWKISWSDVAIGSVENTLKKELTQKLLGGTSPEPGRKPGDQLKDKLKGLLR